MLWCFRHQQLAGSQRRGLRGDAGCEPQPVHDRQLQGAGALRHPLQPGRRGYPGRHGSDRYGPGRGSERPHRLHAPKRLSQRYPERHPGVRGEPGRRKIRPAPAAPDGYHQQRLPGRFPGGGCPQPDSDGERGSECSGPAVRHLRRQGIPDPGGDRSGQHADLCVPGTPVGE
ncbi:Uncharacterised protein [uncultured Blautia sp.]|nr:Uncharacterised protein [uncultured Blautia sp.]